MDLLISVPLVLVVVTAVVWTWWASRSGRDPVSSVDSFHRALDAMQPTRPESSRSTPDPSAATSDSDVATSEPDPALRDPA